MLHEIVEQVMEIACPERNVDFQASQESIIRHVHDELTANLSERVTIEELSRKYLMNATTLKRVFEAGLWRDHRRTYQKAPHGGGGHAPAHHAG